MSASGKNAAGNAEGLLWVNSRHWSFDTEFPLWVCAVERRRFPVGASPTRRPLQPEATGAGMEVTKCLKPSDSGSRNTVTARVCRPQRE